MSLVKIVPNLLCVFRIVSAFVSVFFLIHRNKNVAIMFVVLGSISDFFDGYIARKYNAVSKLGSLLDPFADKVFANIILWGVWFRCPNTVLFVVALILTIRDSVLIGGSLFVIGKKVPLNPILISKVCTTVVFIYAILCLVLSPHSKFVNYIGILSMSLIVLTAIAYSARYITAKKHNNDNSAFSDQ